MIADALPRERAMALIGVLICSAVLLGAFWSPRAMLTGWLGARWRSGRFRRARCCS
ncbi:hypothetical protein [Sphingobium chungbukense]|uniref:hypothetical protein n=1 Tax=Sphingobium chungbukense TaxID=56193 RepID=UPI000AA6ECB1|nr:hypothetical protein [Sphingobium chungbukense]